MDIAVIGTGISGLTCGYYLHKNHAVTLYEANNYIGGHTATVDVEVNNRHYAVDTGFIVYNDKTYPNFIRLMDEIGITGIPTQMSFSVRNDAIGLEYNGHTISTLFAQRKNLLNIQFYRFIGEIVRFNYLAKKASVSSQQEQTLGDFLQHHNFSQYFCKNYILPMGAAIWSSTLADMRSFPLKFFIQFFLNHGLLDITNRPQWRVIKGGSREYIAPLTRGFKDRIKLSSPVEKVQRIGPAVLITSNGETQKYDAVIFACHSDQALKLLAEPTIQESEILSALQYQSNQVTLHTDTSLLPKQKQAWASWNYLLSEEEVLNKEQESQKPRLTYNMNILQHIQSDTTFCVSLNSDQAIRGEKILRQFSYDHPVFTTQALLAQQRKKEISGINNTWFCGAYWHNGFHEDGVKSALEAVKDIEHFELHRKLRGVA